MKKQLESLSIARLSIVVLLSLLGLLISPQSFAFDAPWDQDHFVTDYEDDDDDGPEPKPDCKNSKGSPVFVSSGDLVWNELDIEIKGRMPLQLKRNYNSHDPRDGIFGKGWIANCESTLIKVSAYLVNVSVPKSVSAAYVLVESSGTRHTYTWSADKSSIVAPKWRLDKIEPQIDGSTKLVKLDGSFRLFNKQGYLTQVVDRNGNTLTYSRDPVGRLTRTADGHRRYLDYFYDSTGHVTRVTDHSGRSWQYTYNIDGALIRVSNPMGGIRSYEYQAFGQVDYTNVQVQSSPKVSALISGTVPPSGVITNYQQLTKVTDETGVVELSVTYIGRKVKTYSEGENVYTYTYPNATATVTNVLSKRDSHGSVWKYIYDVNDGQITEKTDPRSYKKRWVYDEHSLVSQYIDQLGKSWNYINDNLGRRTSRIDPLGHETKWTYLADKPWPVTITSPAGHIVTIAYDSKGNKTKVSDATGTVMQFEYNASGDRTAIIDANGNRSETTYSNAGLPVLRKDPLGNITQFEYDSLGRLIKITNPEGEIDQIGYDALDRIVSQTNALNQVVGLSYDAADRLVKVTDASNYNIGVYNYDIYGRVASAIEAGINYVYTYNTNNTLASMVQGDVTHSYGYDYRRQLTTHSTGDVSLRMNYDAKTRLTSVSGNGANVSYTYNATNQVLQEAQSFRRATFAYDNDSELISYAHSGKTYLLQRDARGQLSKFTSPVGAYGFTHDPRGFLTQRQLPNGNQQNFVYNIAGQLKAQDYTQIGGIRYDYVYDKAGRLTEASGDSIRQYSYDSASRLIGAIHDGVTRSYSFDAAGNRTDAGKLYAPANRLTSDASYMYAYDVRGNLSRKTDKTSDTHTDYLYNGLNQLIDVKQYPNATATVPDSTITYKYDAIGRRIKKTNGTIYTDYNWIGNKLIAEYANGRLSTIYSYDKGMVPIEVTMGGNTYTVHTDYLNTPRYLTNQAGQIVWQNKPDPFGTGQVNEDPDNDGNNVSFNIRFPGQYYDQETGLHYNHHRYYDPSTGRYITSDPIGLMGGSNTYAYGGGRPTLMVDIFGLQGNIVKDGLDLYDTWDSVKDPSGVPKKIGDKISSGLSGPFYHDLAKNPINLVKDAAITGTTLGNQFQSGDVTGGLHTIYKFLGLDKVMGGLSDKFGKYTKNGVGGFDPHSGQDGGTDDGGSGGDDNGGGDDSGLDWYIEPPQPPCP